MAVENFYGPLELLIGIWIGDKGKDVSPEPDGPEESEFYEKLTISPAGDLDNVGEQELVAVHYRQMVTRKRDNKIFHQETGFLSWEAEAQTIIQSLAIPRGLTLVAAGRLLAWDSKNKSLNFEVSAGEDNPEWPISNSPFLAEKAKTLNFKHHISVLDGQMQYQESVILDIYGERFEHTDTNKLSKID